MDGGEKARLGTQSLESEPHGSCCSPLTFLPSNRCIILFYSGSNTTMNRLRLHSGTLSAVDLLTICQPPPCNSVMGCARRVVGWVFHCVLASLALRSRSSFTLIDSTTEGASPPSWSVATWTTLRPLLQTLSVRIYGGTGFR